MVRNSDDTADTSVCVCEPWGNLRTEMVRTPILPLDFSPSASCVRRYNHPERCDAAPRSSLHFRMWWVTCWVGRSIREVTALANVDAVRPRSLGKIFRREH